MIYIEASKIVQSLCASKIKIGGGLLCSQYMMIRSETVGYLYINVMHGRRRKEVLPDHLQSSILQFNSELISEFTI